MSPPPNIDPFKGTDWEECDSFIRALRLRALWEGKQRDSAWMADFAGPLFSHKALLWHSRLPQDVRQDWFKLETALLERWVPFDEDDHEAIVPTPAAAPSISHIKRAEQQLQGVLKATIDGSNDIYYVKFKDGNTVCSLTKNAIEALRIRCNCVSDATLLERTDGACHAWLAVQWRALPPNWGDKSTEHSYISLVTSEYLKSSWSNNTPWQILICSISANGEMTMNWRYDDSRKTTLVPFIAGSSLLLVGDPDSYSRRFHSQKRMKLFFEAIDQP